MWITSIHGHVSAVKDNLKPGFMRLRFRTKAHAENIARQIPPAGPADIGRYHVEETPPPADYRWKFSVPVAAWLRLVAVLAEEACRYDNFKGACARTPAMRQHGHTLHDAWAVWEYVQRTEAREDALKAATAPAEKPKRGRPKKASTPDLSSSFDSADELP